jgi:hypothetical protein
MSCDRCENGWLEIDDMPAPCRTCRPTMNARQESAYTMAALSRMSHKKPEPVAKYLSRLAEAMGLGDWVLDVREEPADEGTVAEIDCTLGQKHARVYLCEEWTDLDPVTQRDTLVHELVHAHLSQLRHMADTLFDEVKGGKVAKAAFHLVEEYATEAIAQAWAPLLPLPVATKKGKKK